MYKRRLLLLTLLVIALAICLAALLRSNTPKNIPSNTSGRQASLPDAPELPKEIFVEVIPITFHVGVHQEIPLTEGDAFDPQVSPDGRRIVFLLKTGTKVVLAVAEMPAGAVTAIDPGLDDYANPAWSADGKGIVFAGAKQGATEIYLCNADGQGLRQVTNDPARKKSWPRCSPHTFDNHERIAYTSEEEGRKDIWWVRASGEFDQPITIPPQHREAFTSAPYWRTTIGAPEPITTGGENPEWSPSGNLLLYRTDRGHSLLSYSYYDWWWPTALPLPTASGNLNWSPNQTILLAAVPGESGATIISRFEQKREGILAEYFLTSPPAYFPDGRGFAFTYRDGERSHLAVTPYDDPLGDVANLWMYPFNAEQREKLAQNQLILTTAGNDQIYNLYDSETYGMNTGDHARPYLVTSDAILETFYVAFAGLYAYAERTELRTALGEFTAGAVEIARKEKVAPEVQHLFEVGLALLQPQRVNDAPPAVRQELDRIAKGAEKVESLFGQKLDYTGFFIRGKYERDTDLQGLFRALKWYQAFSFDLEREADRKQVQEILRVTNAPGVQAALARLSRLNAEVIGETRYFSPLSLRELPTGGALPSVPASLPWIERRSEFRLIPPLYTLDAWVFDELITHLKRPSTVGDAQMPRLLPRGLDLMAASGSPEARRILLGELGEGRYARYAQTLAQTAEKIRGFPSETRSSSLYQEWLGTLSVLVQEPAPTSPPFTRTEAWQRKSLNTALGSWVNLRYETIAMVEQGAAEAGEGGYELLNVGRPRGYVEPNPEFFLRLDQAFAKVGTRFEQLILEPALNSEMQKQVKGYRAHLQALAEIARKELDQRPLTDEEYAEILHIGRTVEHFILLMGSLNGEDSEHALRNPDPVAKIVDIQQNPLTGERLYEALGKVDEVDVAVPYFGRRQIVKGPIYSYYEFTSGENLDSTTWRAQPQPPRPVWISPFYAGTSVGSLGELPDLKLKPSR